MHQPLFAEVLDYDGASSDYIGNATTTLGEIVGKRSVVLDIKDRSGQNVTGKIIFRVEQVNDSREEMTVQFRGTKLANLDGLFGKSDPFLCIYRISEDGSWLKVHSTEFIKDNLNPVWQTFSISMSLMCNADPNRPLKFECWDYENDGKHDFIGEFQTSWAQIAQPNWSGQLVNRKGKASGMISHTQCNIQMNFTFIDYLRGGTEFNLMVAVDFTASNMAPSSPQSLHYINPTGQPNEYEMALQSVGSILANYDNNQLFPAYGYGGVPTWTGQLSHCFAMTGRDDAPAVQGINGILDVYKQALQRVQLSGPTLFNPIIRQSIQIAASTPPGQVYHVLLILTDGAIHDFDETVSSIVEASHQLPLSIIIIGVGKSNFGSMENLDSDGQLLMDRRGQRASRDIVQFVPFRKFQGNSTMLAKEVLAELPRQLTSYMKAKNLIPAPPQMMNNSEICPLGDFNPNQMQGMVANVMQMPQPPQ